MNSIRTQHEAQFHYFTFLFEKFLLTSEARCLRTPRRTTNSITIPFLASLPLHRLIFCGRGQRSTGRTRRICSERFTSTSASICGIIPRAKKQALEFGELLSVSNPQSLGTALYSLDQAQTPDIWVARRQTEEKC